MEVHLGVAEKGSGPERLEELALLLRQELLALDVKSVEPSTSGEAPAGTRGAVADVAGALTVTLQPTVQIVAVLVAQVRNWLRRTGTERKVRVEIDGDVLELTGTTTELQQRIVDDWIARHASG
jgi:hypothetical protein